MPFTIPEHERERNVLQKRLKLLTLFDQLVHAGISLEYLEDLEQRGMFADFDNVLNPCDVCDSVKSIYRPEQYAPSKQGEA